MTPPSDPPFGAFAPSRNEERVRAIARRLRPGYLSRRIASALLGPAGGRSGASKDVTVFDSQRARLHPHDNICEKRVYLTPQLWDAAERAMLARIISSTTDENFVFVDVGANAGLYTLFARSVALANTKRFSAVCIEPDREMRRRLGANLAFSSASNDVHVLPFAAARRRERLRFAVDARSRGMSHVATDGEIEVEAAPLSELLGEIAGIRHVDAMKIDIEGGEYDALDAFIADATDALRPAFIIVELSHEDPERSVDSLLAGNGYVQIFRNALNGVYQLGADTTSQTD